MKQYIKNKPLEWALNIGIDVTVRQVNSINQNCTKGKRRKGDEFRLECGTRLMKSPKRYLLSRVFQ